MSALARLEDIEADITEAERLMTALRLKMAVRRSVGEDTTTDDGRLLKMMQAWMLLQDQRKALSLIWPRRRPPRAESHSFRLSA
jgi:hypothetical protein